MALKDKYRELSDVASKYGIKSFEVVEEGGKVTFRGTAPYQLEKDVFWDKLKAFAGWEKEANANIKVEKTDIYGVYTVKSGDTLGKLAKEHLGDAKRYMEIFNVNKDQLTNPDLIKVGQQLKIPNK